MVNVRGIIGNEPGEVSLVSVIEQAQKESGDILVKINSVGGDLDVGFDIYNYLLNLPNKVTTECEGNCASAASVVFLAGDSRIAGCPVMIHNPYIEGVTGDSETLKNAAEWIGLAEKELEKVYASRTKLDAETLSSLMKNETYLSPNQAVTLGFATTARPEAIAMAKININKIIKNNSKMAETDKKSFGSILREALGMKPKNEAPKDEKTIAYNMVLTTADGGELEIDREEGVPQIGDSASPGGSHTMPDGSVIVVENGVITEIVSASNEADIDENTVEEVAESVEQLIEELQSEVNTLKEEVAQAKKMAKTHEEIKILNAVKMAGGADKVLKNFQSSYKPQGRIGVKGKQEVQKASKIAEKLAETKEKRGIN